MKQNLFIAVGAVVLISFVTLIYLGWNPQEGGDTDASDERAVRTITAEWGARLKNVPLLAEEAALKNELAQQYGIYLSPELLAAWQANPHEAIGRQTSSPWPERIDIVQVQKNGEEYTVSGNVVEITSQQPNPAGVYPITLRFAKTGGQWRIAAVTRGAYGQLPHMASIEGVTECLPHATADGPQTMECAFGLQTDTGAHYAVDLQKIENGALQFQTGKRVRIEGTVVPKDQLSTTAWDSYPIEGIIAATAITE